MTTSTNIPLVSVLIPVYNASQYLVASINSIVNQSYQNLEIIIIDDGSTDNSWELLQTINDDRIRLFRNSTNLGVAATLNIGLKKVKGEYLVRHDADDISYPERIKIQVDFLIANPKTQVVGSAYEKKFPSGKSERCLYSNNNLLTITECILHHPTCTLKMDLIKKYDLTYESKAEDYFLWNKIFKANNYYERTFVNLDQVLIQYTIHPNQCVQKFRIELINVKLDNQLSFLEDFIAHHSATYSFPRKYSLVEIKKFMNFWDTWGKPTNFSSIEYNELKRRFFFTLIFHKKEKGQLFRTLLAYIKFVPFNYIQFLRLIKKNIWS